MRLWELACRRTGRRVAWCARENGPAGSAASGWSVGSTQPSAWAEARQCGMLRRTRGRDVRARARTYTVRMRTSAPLLPPVIRRMTALMGAGGASVPNDIPGDVLRAPRGSSVVGAEQILPGAETASASHSSLILVGCQARGRTGPRRLMPMNDPIRWDRPRTRLFGDHRPCLPRQRLCVSHNL